jgi:hypothetical protein
MSDDSAKRLKRFIEELAQAEALLDVRPAYAQTLALLAVNKILESLGLRSSALSSIATGMLNAVLKHHHGGAIKDVQDTRALAEAAAFVTKQVGAGFPLKEVLRDVSERSGLDEKDIRKFRDNVSRGRVSEFALGMYADYLARM